MEMESLEYLKTLFESLLKEAEKAVDYAKENGFPQWSIGYREGQHDSTAFALETINDEIERIKKSPYAK